MENKVAIIVLNWNGWEDTLECLESLFQINYQYYDLIVVDNDSEDHSLEKIRDYCNGKIKVKSSFFKYSNQNKPINIFEYFESESKIADNICEDYFKLGSNEKLFILKNEKNYGYAEGNNIGIKFALNKLSPDYILILNNDTVVDRNFLKELINTSDSEENVGFVGPKTYYYDFEGRKDIINFAGGKFNMWLGIPSHIDMKNPDNTLYNQKIVDYVNGSCMLINIETLKKIGLLDSTYFLYWEENDWCYRASKLKLKSFYAPKAKIWHKTKVSIEKLGKIKDYYMIRNRIIFMKKYASKIQFFTFFIYLTFQICMNLILYLIHMSKTDFHYYLKGIKDGLIYKINK